MYIDQLADSSTVYVSDLKVVSNDLCHGLNQMPWNIEKCSYCCQPPSFLSARDSEDADGCSFCAKYSSC